MRLRSSLLFDLRQAIRMRLENLPAAPTFSSSEQGRAWFNSSSRRIGLNTGTANVEVRDTGTPLVNGDISATAAIALSKLATDPLQRTNHTGTQTAATISDFTTVVKTVPLNQMAQPIGNVNMGSQRVGPIAPPVSAQDAATKAYVDAVAQGLAWKVAARVATTANINLASPGAAINGVSLSNGDRVLVKNQTTPSQNGIYTWDSASTAMSRASDADTWTELVSAAVFIEAGSTLADTLWVCTSDRGGTLGTTAVTWGQIGGPSEVTASGGLAKVGNDIRIADGGVTAAKIATTVIGDGAGEGLTWRMSPAGRYYLAALVDGTSLGFKPGGVEWEDGSGFWSQAIEVKDGGITTGKLADLSVATGKLEDGAVTAAKLANGAINLNSAKVAGTPLPIWKGGTGGTTAVEGRYYLGATGKYVTETHPAGTTITVSSLTHGLGDGGCIVQCQIAASGEVVYADVTIDSANTVTVTFDTAQAANTIRVTVIG